MSNRVNRAVLCLALAFAMAFGSRAHAKHSPSHDPATLPDWETANIDLPANSVRSL